MSDPRNVAHDKTVMEEKRHHGEDPAEGAAVTPQPGKKPPQIHHDAPDDAESAGGSDD
jgi:hypothetical protein